MPGVDYTAAGRLMVRAMHTEALQVLRFSTDNFPQHERITAYREIYGGMIVTHDIEPIGDEPFRFEATLCKLPDLGMASSVISPSRRSRRRRGIDGDDVLLGFSLGGDCVVRQNGREASIRNGEAVLTRSADPVAIVIPSPSPALTLRIPDSILRARTGDLDAWVTRPISVSAESRLLTGYIAALWASDALLNPTLGAIAGAHIHDLVSLMLGANAESREMAQRGGLRAARLAAVLRAIECRSGEIGLNAAVIAAELGVTPRYVHLVLEETGSSFTRHLLERRLQKAAALLRNSRWRQRRVADVALEAGFNDLSYFNRSFRRRYSATPLEIRQAASCDAAE